MVGSAMLATAARWNCPYDSNQDRIDALAPWLEYYNTRPRLARPGASSGRVMVA
jgi:hypothetical protein